VRREQVPGGLVAPGAAPQHPLTQDGLYKCVLFLGEPFAEGMRVVPTDLGCRTSRTLLDIRRGAIS